MELLDILDKQGNRTGEKKPKEQVHIDGDWHRAVHVWFVTPQGELLIQRRSKSKINHPDKWDISAAGHVSAGEDSKTSALREVQEEVGLTIEKDELQFLATLTQQSVINDGTYDNKEYGDVFLVEKSIAVDELSFKDGEVSDARLIHWKDLQTWVDGERDDIVQHTEEYGILFDYLEKNYP